jgi:phosphatidylglycerophosphatase A
VSVADNAPQTPSQNKVYSLIVKTLASGLGTGYSPLASGTAGSLLAVVIWWYLPEILILKLVLTLIILVISIPISTAAEELYAKKDDSRIVIDEVIGMWLSLIFVPHNIKYYAAALLSFRLFGVIKPLGIKKIQSWHGGWGIVMDDVFAGLLSNIVLQIGIYAAGLL